MTEARNVRQRGERQGGCYRTNANMIAIDGIEGDHDAGTMGVDKALELLRVSISAETGL